MEAELPDWAGALFEPHRYKVIYGGRGGSRSWSCARALLIRGTQEKILVICAREFQNSIDDSVHRLLAEQIELMGLGWAYTVQNNVIRGKNGTEFVFKGIKQNINNIKSFEGADVCWVEEAATVSENSWRVLIPTIRKDGSEIWVTFNPERKADPTYKRFVLNPPPNAWVKKASWRDNPWFTDVLRAEKDHDREVDEETYLHVWEGEIRKFADGAVYKKQITRATHEGRISPVPIVDGAEVNTYWDLGKNDHTAIWFVQNIGLQKRVIDYYQNRLVDLGHYINVLKKLNYTYGEHYLPHDVEQDILGMNETRREQLERGGVKPLITVPRIREVNEGVEMVRRVFPDCWFDTSRVDHVLDEADFPEGLGDHGVEYGVATLSNYKLKFDEEKDVHTRFVHDWASNGADAFRQFAQAYRPGKWQSQHDEKGPVKTYTRNNKMRVKIPDVV